MAAWTFVGHFNLCRVPVLGAMLLWRWFPSDCAVIDLGTCAAFLCPHPSRVLISFLHQWDILLLVEVSVSSLAVSSLVVLALCFVLAGYFWLFMPYYSLCNLQSVGRPIVAGITFFCHLPLVISCLTLSLHQRFKL